MTSNSLAPTLLLSMPQLTDPNFSRTVVLLCKHSEEGAFGLVVNRPLVTSGRVVVNLEAGEQEDTLATERELQVWLGGPVEPQRSWMLVGYEPEANDEPRGTRIAEALYLSTSPDLLRRLLESNPLPRTRLVVGYSGWGPGQLEAELQASAWLMSDVDSGVIPIVDDRRPSGWRQPFAGSDRRRSALPATQPKMSRREALCYERLNCRAREHAENRVFSLRSAVSALIVITPGAFVRLRTSPTCGRRRSARGCACRCRRGRRCRCSRGRPLRRCLSGSRSCSAGPDLYRCTACWYCWSLPG